MKLLRSLAMALCLLPSLAQADFAAPPANLKAVDYRSPQLVASGGKNNNGFVTASGWTRMDCKRLAVAGPNGASDIQLAVSNFYQTISQSPAEQPIGNPTTIDAAIQIDAPETTSGISVAPIAVPVFWNGQPTATLASGAANVLSDPTGVNLTPGQKFWIRTSVLVAASAKVPTGFTPRANGEACVTTSGASQSASTASLSGTAASAGYSVAAVLGRGVARSASVWITGDSISDAVGDTGFDANGNAGFIMRGLATAGPGGTQMPSIQNSLSGDYLKNNLMAPSNGARRMALAAFATHAIVQPSTNDIVLGFTFAQMQANARPIWADLKRRGLKVYVTTAMPRTTSTVPVSSLTSSGTTVTATVASTATISNGQSIAIAGATPAAYNGTFPVTVVDATTFQYTAASAPGTSPATGTITWSDLWASAVNQTPVSGFAPGGTRDQWNNWLYTARSQGLIDGVIDSGSTVEDPNNHGLWSSNGTPNYLTADGTHPSAAGHVLGAAAITAAAATWRAGY